jgi:DNA-binding transcriptional regulator GbsR (MarR family)
VDVDSEARDRRLQFVEHVGLHMEDSGLPRMAGRVLGWLLISEPAVQSSAQLVAALGASKGSISTNTRLLMRTGLIERVARPGGRGAFFRIKPDAWSQILESQIAKIRAFREICDEGLAITGGRPRLEEMRDFYLFMEEEYPMMLSHWREHRGAS